MLLSEFKNKLESINELIFLKPDGTLVPKHFHITEVGQINKKFIDCGGVVRNENVISLQLWESIDVWHRLAPQKLIDIIDLSINKLEIGDYEIEVEYQGVDTISKYHLSYDKDKFLLLPTNTTCLASDKCGIPSVETIKEKVQSCCTPGSGCC